MLTSDVAVVGAGPAGIVLSLELSRAGYDVLVIESGRRGFDPDTLELSDEASRDLERHAALRNAMRRQVGGTSTIWGGRCVPYDPVDFDRRAAAGNVEWPIAYDDIFPYHQRACDWLRCGRAVFSSSEVPGLPPSLVPGLTDDKIGSATSLERWSLPTDFGHEYGQELARSRRIRVATGLTCIKVDMQDPATIDHLECRVRSGHNVAVRARVVVIAAGGLETTRLLLSSPRPDGIAIGNHSDHLGRWYMGHCEGSIADVRFNTDPRRTIFGYERDVDGVYVRRRFSFTREHILARTLPNIVSWISNWEPADPAHHSGVLSFAYLALLSPLGRVMAPDAQRLALTSKDVVGTPYPAVEPGPLRLHVRNIVRDLPRTSAFAFDFGVRRFVAPGRKSPGFFVYRPDNTYRLAYHGEQMPRRDSRVALSQQRDALGMPRLDVDLRFSEEDALGVVAAHREWDSWLRRQGLGEITFRDADPPASVWRHLGGGFHQVGTTRASRRPEDGVCDANLRVHGIKGLYVASSSSFPTSGQANSTFLVVALTLRLADHLRATLGPTRLATSRGSAAPDTSPP